MMQVSITRTFLVSGQSDLDAITDQVMEALLEFEAIDSTLHDSDVTAELTARTVTLGLVVDAETLDDGERHGLQAITAAIATSNGHLTAPIVEGSSFVSQASSAELVPA